MPTVRTRTALGANATANPMSDSQYETLPFSALVEIGVKADATGVLATVASGGDLLQEEGPVTIGTINELPKYPDDFVSDIAAMGDKLKIGLRDTSGAARVVMTEVRITPL